jgi:hypothetical protein
MEAAMQRQPKPIPTEAFEPLMAEALTSFGTDPEYMIRMATKASLILFKQRTWKSRLTIRAAEAAARAQCEAAVPFSCDSELPCGVGPLCRWSSGELREIEGPAPALADNRGGKFVEQVQPSADGTHRSYNSESVVPLYRERLEGFDQLA